MLTEGDTDSPLPRCAQALQHGAAGLEVTNPFGALGGMLSGGERFQSCWQKSA